MATLNSLIRSLKCLFSIRKSWTNPLIDKIAGLNRSASETLLSLWFKSDRNGERKASARRRVKVSYLKKTCRLRYPRGFTRQQLKFAEGSRRVDFFTIITSPWWNLENKREAREGSPCVEGWTAKPRSLCLIIARETNRELRKDNLLSRIYPLHQTANFKSQERPRPYEFLNYKQNFQASISSKNMQKWTLVSNVRTINYQIAEIPLKFINEN